MANLREHSQMNFSSSGTLEQIQIGALQRIADATEKMASNYTALQNDRDLYMRWWKEQKAYSQKLARRISALQGVITKLKKKA